MGDGCCIIEDYPHCIIIHYKFPSIYVHTSYFYLYPHMSTIFELFHDVTNLFYIKGAYFCNLLIIRVPLVPHLHFQMYFKYKSKLKSTKRCKIFHFQIRKLRRSLLYL